MFILDIGSWAWCLDLDLVAYLLCPCIPLDALWLSALIHVIYFELRTLISFTLYAISLCCHQSPKRGDCEKHGP